MIANETLSEEAAATAITRPCEALETIPNAHDAE